jgi:hypothetical protein
MYVRAVALLCGIPGEAESVLLQENMKTYAKSGGDVLKGLVNKLSNGTHSFVEHDASRSRLTNTFKRTRGEGQTEHIEFVDWFHAPMLKSALAAFKGGRKGDFGYMDLGVPLLHMLYFADEAPWLDLFCQEKPYSMEAGLEEIVRMCKEELPGLSNSAEGMKVTLGSGNAYRYAF